MKRKTLPKRYGVDKEGYVYDRQDDDKFRVTPCCLAYPTVADDGTLCCKACWEIVADEINQEAVLA